MYEVAWYIEIRKHKGGDITDQTLDCILHAQRQPDEKEAILDCIESDINREIVIDRHRMKFDPNTQTVTITRASEDVPFAAKIIGCRMKYSMMKRLLNGDYDNISETEWSRID